MIWLVLAQVATRWGQALMLLVVSTAATAAAVGVTVYSDTVDRAAIAEELAAAGPGDRVVSLPVSSRTWADPPESLNEYAPILEQMPDFTPVTSVTIRVRGLREEAPAELTRMLGRDGFCRHAVFEAGRCPVGGREAALPASLAEQTGLGPGDELMLEPVVFSGNAVQSDGPPVAILVVGVFDAREGTEPYWAAALDPLGRAGQTPAILTNRSTVQGIEKGFEGIAVNAILPDDVLTPGRIPAVRAQLDAAESRSQEGLSRSLNENISGMLDRVVAHGRDARELLPVTAAPLVALCWLVVHLAVGHSVSARRLEIGVVVLRGAKARTRSVMAVAESLVPVLLGVPVGVVAAYLLVALASPTGVEVTVRGAQLLPVAVSAGLAGAGSVVAALAAQRRELAAPVAHLLRRVPPRRRLAVAAGELLVVALAAVVVADLRVFDRDLAGLLVVTPAVVMVGVTVLAARALRPVVGLAGRWSLRRGTLGIALAALYLARRPGAARLVVALGLVLGMLGFAIAGSDVAAQGRLAQVERELGAARVLSVDPVDRGALLAAVRAADPQGRYAMAVVADTAGGDQPWLAVDTTRLARVAVWPAGGPVPEEVAAMLRPPVPEPPLVHDGELVAELSPAIAGMADHAVTVSWLLAPVTGGEPVVVENDPVAADQRAYPAEVTGCPDGCRLAGLTVTSVQPVSDAEHQAPFARRFAVLVHALRQDGRDLAGSLQWRPPDGGEVTDRLAVGVGTDGLRLSHRSPRIDEPYLLLTADAPHPLPVATAGPRVAAEALTDNIDHEPILAREVASLDVLPGVAGPGVLMDLEYAQRSTLEPGETRGGQVWLVEDTPEEVVHKLAEEGLVVTDSRTVDGLRGSLDRAGAALALRFFLLAGAVAALVGLLALALVAAVDRRGGGRDLRDLRMQGLAARTTALAALWSYGGVVLAAAVAGALAALAAWLATGDRLPLGVDRSVLPSWPQWAPVLAPWTVVVAVLLAAAAAAAWWQWARLRGEVRG